MEETIFDSSKGLVLGKVLAEEVFALKPDVLDGILLRGIGRETQTDDLPVLFLEAVVDLGQQSPDLGIAVITGPVPSQDDPFPWITVP